MLWGGRFSESLDNAALEFSSSIEIDINLIKEDLLISKVHAEMLSSIGIIKQEESARIIEGLKQIEQEYLEGKWNPAGNEVLHEDIHSAIEARLYELIGDTAGKLHTGRSRNDQAVTGLRLWVKSSVKNLLKAVKQFQLKILDLAAEHVNTVIPGYTHMQRAQPVSFAFHLLAYFEMLKRDKNRLEFILKEADVSPLGSGALAGSSIPIDRDNTAAKLGFSSVSHNAMDGISDRDFVLDYLHCCVSGMLHLSRLAEEIIIWSSSEWNFIKLSDRHSTGSSLMPQKKNPDLAELIRGKAGYVLGQYTSFAAVLKGLPMSYNRDLQLDKECLFTSVNIFLNSLIIASEMLGSLTINKQRFVNELDGDFSLATDLADWLVIKGVSFREAHSIVGKVVRYAEEKKKKLNELNIDELKIFSSVFDPLALEVLNINNALERKLTFGSTNPDFVNKQIVLYKSELTD